MSIYIWSDLHLGHNNIIKYEDRPFTDISLMNKLLIKNWRETVSSDDTIINLGDVCFKFGKEKLSKVIKNLPGHKILVLGNHDRSKSINWWREAGFDEVYKYPIIYDKFYILSHEPIYINRHMPYVNVHGHMHSKQIDDKQCVNVSVELIDYKPILFDSIKEMFNGL